MAILMKNYVHNGKPVVFFTLTSPDTTKWIVRVDELGNLVSFPGAAGVNTDFKVPNQANVEVSFVISNAGVVSAVSGGQLSPTATLIDDLRMRSVAGIIYRIRVAANLSIYSTLDLIGPYIEDNPSINFWDSYFGAIASSGNGQLSRSGGGSVWAVAQDKLPLTGDFEFNTTFKANAANQSSEFMIGYQTSILGSANALPENNVRSAIYISTNIALANVVYLFGAGSGYNITNGQPRFLVDIDRSVKIRRVNGVITALYTDANYVIFTDYYLGTLYITSQIYNNVGDQLVSSNYSESIAPYTVTMLNWSFFDSSFGLTNPLAARTQVFKTTKNGSLNKITLFSLTAYNGVWSGSIILDIFLNNGTTTGYPNGTFLGSSNLVNYDEFAVSPIDAEFTFSTNIPLLDSTYYLVRVRIVNGVGINLSKFPSFKRGSNSDDPNVVSRGSSDGVTYLTGTPTYEMAMKLEQVDQI